MKNAMPLLSAAARFGSGQQRSGGCSLSPLSPKQKTRRRVRRTGAALFLSSLVFVSHTSHPQMPYAHTHTHAHTHKRDHAICPSLRREPPSQQTAAPLAGPRGITFPVSPRDAKTADDLVQVFNYHFHCASVSDYHS